MKKSDFPQYLTYAFFKRTNGVYPENYGKEDIINAEISRFDASAPYANYKVSREDVIEHIHKNAAKLFARHVDEWDSIRRGEALDINKFAVDRSTENIRQEEIESMPGFVRWV